MTSVKREFGGWEGWTEYQKFPSIFFIFSGCKGIVFLMHILKYCHQNCYGFKNLMLSWGVGILFSKLHLVHVFMNNNAKSKEFQTKSVGFYFS